MHHLFFETVEERTFSVLIPVEFRPSASPPQGVLAAEWQVCFGTSWRRSKPHLSTGV